MRYSEHQKKSMSALFRGFYKLPMVRTDNRRVLLNDGEILTIGDIKIECLLVPGHTWGHMVYLPMRKGR